MRYLASTHKAELYGGENNHMKSLIDQWLDITTCDFEPVISAILYFQQGKEVDFAKLMEDCNKFMAMVEKHLKGRKFLVGDNYTLADLSLASSVSVVFSVMLGEGPRKKYTNTLAWYMAMTEVQPEVGPKDLPKEADDAFKGGKKGKKEEKEDKGKKGGKKEEGKKKEGKKEDKKKEETKKDDDDDDLFGDDDPSSTPAPAPEKPKPKKEPKKKPVAKSIIVFDVKVYEQEEDLHKLFEKIKNEIKVEGLVWNEEEKILPVAFGMNKLQVGCVIEDAKVSIEDIYERLEEWEEVQSTDTVSFQKL